MFTIFKVQAISHFLKQKKNSSRDLRYNATPWQKKKKEQRDKHNATNIRGLTIAFPMKLKSLNSASKFAFKLEYIVNFNCLRR